MVGYQKYLFGNDRRVLALLREVIFLNNFVSRLGTAAWICLVLERCRKEPGPALPPRAREHRGLHRKCWLRPPSRFGLRPHGLPP